MLVMTLLAHSKDTLTTISDMRTLALLSAKNWILGLAATLVIVQPECPSTQPRERGYLDATPVQIRQRLREPAGGHSEGNIVGWSDGRPHQSQTLAMTFKILGPTELALGEEFEYEVQIQNTSDHTVEIPWDLSQRDIEPPDAHTSYDYQTAAISVIAKEGQGKAVIIDGSVLLFGSPSITSTMIALEPGDWVRIKAKGRDTVPNPSQAWPEPQFVGKRIGGTLAATLTLSKTSFLPGSSGNEKGHEEARNISVPIYSNAFPVQFSF